MFEANEINGACLVEGLDDETLVHLGVVLPVVRKRIQTEIKQLFR